MTVTQNAPDFPGTFNTHDASRSAEHETQTIGAENRVDALVKAYRVGELAVGQRGRTGAELAAQLGVTDRAARRYVDILRKAGIPVDSVSGRNGGYSVGRGALVPPLMFSTAEALGLVVALLRGWHEPIDAGDPAATALGKILRVLSDAAAAPAEALRRVVTQNPSDAAATPDPTLTAQIAHASETHHRLQIACQSRPGSDYQMIVDPWSVVVRHGRWYLLYWSLTADARRVCASIGSSAPS